MKQIALAGFSLVCLACVVGMAFVLFDIVAGNTGSLVSGYGAVAVFIMAIAFAVRLLWEKRQIDR